MPITGAGLGGGNQPPLIRDSETTAFVEVMKKNVLAMLPADTMEVIPFTQRTFDELFKYRSEPGKPSLHALLNARTAGAFQDVPKEQWEPAYQSLLNKLPPEIQEGLEQEALKPMSERSPEYSELNSFLMFIAKGLGWLESALQPIAPNSGAEKDFMLNLILPYVALRGVLDQTNGIFADIQARLDEVGPNEPGYDTVVSNLSQVQQDVAELNQLRKSLEKDGNNPEIKQRMTDISNDLMRISAFLHREGGCGEYKILGNITETLSLVSQAWAMEYGSPSLFLSLDTVFTGISNSDSGLGIWGNALGTVLNAILDGLLISTSTGPRVQLEEMYELYQSLAELRDQSKGG